jgi:hypothetical protein
MRRRHFLTSLAAIPAAGLVTPRETCAQQRGPMPAGAPFKASDGSNNPVGEGKGLHPGRVTWVRDAKAATWDGVTGNWWDDAFTNQKLVHSLTTRSIERLTGRSNGKQAWDALFRGFNEAQGHGRAGYRPGERIAIKVNCNQDRGPKWGVGQRGPQNGLPSPHAIVALVTQLIEVAGVRGEDIMLYDAANPRNIGSEIYNRVRADSNSQYQAVKFLVGADYDQGGRMTPVADTDNPIRFSNGKLPTAYLPKQVTEAKYMINMALMRPHGMAGVTLTAKNHFGSVHFPSDGGWTPRTLHGAVQRTQAMGSYNALVDLIGHRHLGGKTMLYVLDGLYTAEHNEGSIAIDSVALDILASEPRAKEVRGAADNYLHEAAQAARPPSGTEYNPDGAGARASLGVHEHWNSAAERKYSRNLGRKSGIELIAEVGA